MGAVGHGSSNSSSSSRSATASTTATSSTGGTSSISSISSISGSGFDRYRQGVSLRYIPKHVLDWLDVCW